MRMTLFRRNGVPLTFVLKRFSLQDYDNWETIITTNGGIASRNDNELPIVFLYPKYYIHSFGADKKYFNVEYIRECVAQSRIVDPRPYRLGPKLLFDECVMNHFLFGHCSCRGEERDNIAGNTLVAVESGRVAVRPVAELLPQGGSEFSEEYATPIGSLPPSNSNLPTVTENSALLTSPISPRATSNAEVSPPFSLPATPNVEVSPPLSLSFESCDGPNSWREQKSLNGFRISEEDFAREISNRRCVQNRSAALSSGDGHRESPRDSHRESPRDSNDKVSCAMEFETAERPEPQRFRRTVTNYLGLAREKDRRLKKRTATTLSSVPETSNSTSDEQSSENPATDKTSVRTHVSGDTEVENANNNPINLEQEPNDAPASPTPSETPTVCLNNMNPIPGGSNHIVPEDTPALQHDGLHAGNLVQAFVYVPDEGPTLLTRTVPLSSSSKSQKTSPVPKRISRTLPTRENSNSSLVRNPFGKHSNISNTSTRREPKITGNVETPAFSSTRIEMIDSDESSDEEIMFSRIPPGHEDHGEESRGENRTKRSNERAGSRQQNVDWNKPGPSGNQAKQQSKLQVSNGNERVPAYWQTSSSIVSGSNNYSANKSSSPEAKKRKRFERSPTNGRQSKRSRRDARNSKTDTSSGDSDSAEKQQIPVKQSSAGTSRRNEVRGTTKSLASDYKNGEKRSKRNGKNLTKTRPTTEKPRSKPQRFKYVLIDGVMRKIWLDSPDENEEEGSSTNEEPHEFTNSAGPSNVRKNKATKAASPAKPAAKPRDNVRAPRRFTHIENFEIIDYLARTRSISRARRINVFENMRREAEGLIDWTAESLSNQFFYVILPNIDQYVRSCKLQDDDVRKFKNLNGS